MILLPVNKLLVIDKLPQEKKRAEVDGFNFVVPESVQQPRYSVVKLLRTDRNSAFEVHVGKLVLVQTSLIDEVEFNGHKYSTVTENAVVGILQENEL